MFVSRIDIGDEKRGDRYFPFGGLGGLAIAAFLFPSFGFSGLEELGFFF